MSIFLAVQAVDNSRFLIITVIAIVVGLLIAGVLESRILTRLGWAAADKAILYAASNNMITPVLAFVFLAAVFAVFIVIGVKSFTNFEEQRNLKLFTYLLFPLLIVIVRRQMLSVLKIRSDVWSWVYAFVSTKITFWFMFIAIVVFYEILK